MTPNIETETKLRKRRKELIRKLLKGIETGDPQAVAVVNEAEYIQHNPQTHEGSEGLAALFARLAKSNPKVNIVRVFSDGDYVFAHTEYDFATRRIGFEVFRFEGEQAVEHWDNIQPRKGPNLSGRSMVDGPIETQDLDKTEANREIVRGFINQVFIEGRLEQLDNYLDEGELIQHSPAGIDGVEGLKETLAANIDGVKTVVYEKNHRVLAEGSFVLTVSEGRREGQHTAFYDLYRLQNGKIVEHWDTVEKVAPKSQWKNDNGKF